MTIGLEVNTDSEINNFSTSIEFAIRHDVHKVRDIKTGRNTQQLHDI